jgi:MSHA biogenesis protein MshM
MLCRKSLNSLENYPKRYQTAFMPHPILSEADALQVLADELHIEIGAAGSYYERLKAMSRELLAVSASGKRSVLLIDEAQAMPEETLLALVLLTQIEAQYPLQVVLFGQPELDQQLDLPNLRNVSRQIRVAFSLPALEQAELNAFVDYRLNKAGFNGQLFDDDALLALFKASRGIPRLVNILCHKALLAGFGKGLHRIGRAEIDAAVCDTEAARSLTVSTSNQRVN